MGCIYEDQHGDCSLYDEENFVFPDGCPNGDCEVSNHPDPSEVCDVYESDKSCLICGQDRNVNDCDCEEVRAEKDRTSGRYGAFVEHDWDSD